MFWDYDKPDHKIILWIIFIPSIIISFIVFLIATYNALNVRQNLSIDIHLRVIAVFGLSFYLTSIISYMYGEISIGSIYYEGTPYNIVRIAWVLANTSIFVIFTEQMRIILKNTAYRSPRYVFIFIYGSLILYIGGESVVIIIQILNLKHTKLYNIMLNINFIIHIILSLFLLFLFIKKLMLLTVSVAEDLNIKSMPGTPTMNATHQINKTPAKWNFSMSSFNALNDSGTSAFQTSNSNMLRMGMATKKGKKSTFHRVSMLHLSGQQTKWLNIITKLTILSMWSLIITDCWLLYDTIIYGIWDHCSDSLKDLLHLISVLLLCVDTVINCIVIFFSFQFAERQYLKCCCCCDRCCNRCCVRITRRDMIKKWTERELKDAVDIYVSQQIHQEVDGYTELGAVQQQ